MLDLIYFKMQGMNDRLIVNREYREPDNLFYRYYYKLGFMSALTERQAYEVEVFKKALQKVVLWCWVEKIRNKWKDET